MMMMTMVIYTTDTLSHDSSPVPHPPLFTKPHLLLFKEERCRRHELGLTRPGVLLIFDIWFSFVPHSISGTICKGNRKTSSNSRWREDGWKRWVGEKSWWRVLNVMDSLKLTVVCASLCVCVCSLSQKVLKSYNKAVVSCLNTALNYYTKYILYKLRCLVCLNQTLVWICSGRSVHRNCTHIFTETLQAAFTPHLFGAVQTNCVFADLIWSGWCESVNQTGSFVPWRGFQCHWSNL